jgi:NAD(P)-dependent dehydrogenase (short-subunit alcohol dehydrogenase family)
MRLEGKVALVTGGSRSIGRAIALGYAREGADVAVNFERDAAAADEVVSEIGRLGRKALAVQADVAAATQVQSMVQTVVAALGRLDILVNNAGTLSRAPFLELSEAAWDRVLDVDLKGVFLVSQAVARHMVGQGGGAIINISSIAAHLPSAGQAHYSAAKAGVAILTRAMALELAAHGIRVNAIEPGMVITDMNRARFSEPATREAVLARMPLGRFGTPEEMVGAAVYLASDEAAFATGGVIRLDGGRTIT